MGRPGGYSTCTDDKVWQWRKELEGQLKSSHKETDKLRRFDYYIFPPTTWNRIGPRRHRGISIQKSIRLDRVKQSRMQKRDQDSVGYMPLPPHVDSLLLCQESAQMANSTLGSVRGVTDKLGYCLESI
ncbi:uncharacterized protein QC761_105488 [Podospora bellae-mahoneyi]|uniref:Uncharacterized protein n=1 Tax=Podospora bellae-mahoneyi TaxID=2093777 RepID=A0ABR0FY15_9PEZI|nr:hypothetical protein QC761_105488 [Podospora bellae-mahoneyi]